ncbi:MULTISPECIES: DUF1661 domain-containing protein [Porphyromonas]
MVLVREVKISRAKTKNFSREICRILARKS